MTWIPSPLTDDIAEGRCLPFIGAGFSLNAELPLPRKMPTWHELASILAQIASSPPGLNDLQIASHFQRQFGRVELIEQIRRAIHVSIAEPGDAHKAFADLPFDTVYTTNFDLLLEEGYRLSRRPYRSLVGERQMPFHAGHRVSNIVKMHGDVLHEEHIVITEEDFNAFRDRYPIISTHLSAMLITRTALYIGYSRTDPNFRNIQDVIHSRLGDFERFSYLIDFDVTLEHQEQMLAERIHVISLDTAGSTKALALTAFFREVRRILDTQEAARLREQQPGVFERIPLPTVAASIALPEGSTLLASSSNICFVSMPFTPQSNQLFYSAIGPAIERAGLTTLRLDDVDAGVSVAERARSVIRQARLMIADVTNGNPNVMYEVGLAIAFGTPVIYVSTDRDHIPVDLYNKGVLARDDQDSDAFVIALHHAIDQRLTTDQLGHASQLIRDGLYRPGIALLGAILEHALQERARVVGLRGTYEERFSVGLAARTLRQADYISDAQYEDIVRAREIRNRAVHELSELSAEDASFMLRTVVDFIAS